MRVDTFGRGVIFAAVATLFAMAWQSVAGPVIGSAAALQLAVCGLTVAWLFCIAPSAAAGFKITLVTAPLALLIAVYAPGPIIAAIALTVIIGVTRGVFVQRRAAARAVALEVAVGCGALILAAIVLEGSIISVGLTIWAYFLVQSMATLPGGGERSPVSSADGDAFDRAHARAERLLKV